MRRDDLIEMMKAAGVAPAEAEARADATLADNRAADTLNKSLEALADVANAQAQAEAAQASRPRLTPC
jgi:acetolactate synthase regulatory subunit